MGRYRPPKPPASNFLTPEGAKALREELDSLWRRKRPEVTRAVAEAAAQGDRSENADYIYGKKQLAEIDRRVRYLRKRLAGVRIVDRPPSDLNRVFFGAWFELRDASGAVQRYRLVGPDEIAMGTNYVSMDSPLGKAVLGRARGAPVSVVSPGGSGDYQIAEIDYAAPEEKKARS